MQSTDITAKVKNYIRFGLATVILLAALLGYAEFQYWHRLEVIELTDAKVAGTIVSVRVLANGKVKELSFEDGAEVKAGDVIARLEVAITEEEIRQLEDTVQLAKDNYAELQLGQTVTVPVQRERVVYPPAPPTVHYSSGSASSLARLEERANRMAELFDMGAVSAVERDKARAAYESALAESQSATYEYSAVPQPIIEYYTEYVEEFRPTPPEVLAGAEQAIRQAELSLNVARQEARETDVIAPVSGTIYYSVEVDQDLSAGESVAGVGDSRELWIEAEVTEEIFNKIPLGKLVSYSIDGRELFGTVIEKIRPNVEQPAEETPAPIELPEIPTSGNQPGALIGDNPPVETPAENLPAENSPAENPDAGKIRAIINSFRENPQIVEAETEIINGDDKIRAVLDSIKENSAQSAAETPANETPAVETPNAETPAVETPAVETPNVETPANENPNVENPNAENPANENAAPQPPKFLDGTESRPKPNDKFIIKISLPAERDFDCQPNTKTTVRIKI